MNKPKELDVIELLEDINELGLKKGDIGAIILVFDRPSEAYEVEFVNEENGATRVMCTLTRDQFKVVEHGPG